MRTGIFTHIKKAAVTTLLAGAVLLIGPSFASATTDAATPSKGDHFSVVDRASMPTNLDQTVSSSKSGAEIQAAFNCYYAQYPSDLFLDCVITEGALQFVIYCSDDNTYFSPWFGPGSWLIHGSCGPSLLTAWGVIQM